MRKLEIKDEIYIPDYFKTIPLSENDYLLKSPNNSFKISIKEEKIDLIFDKLKEKIKIQDLLEEVDLPNNKILTILDYFNEKGILKKYKNNIEKTPFNYFDRYATKNFKNFNFLKNKKVLFAGSVFINTRLIDPLFDLGLVSFSIWNWSDKKDIPKQLSKVSKKNSKGFYEDHLVNAYSYSMENIDKLKEEISNVDLIVLSTNSFSPQIHQTVNKFCMEEDIPLFGIRKKEDEIEFGPCVIPGKSPCFNCYIKRIKSNIADRNIYNKYLEYMRDKNDSFNLPPYLFGVVESYGVDEIIRCLTGYKRPITLGNVLRIQFQNPQITKNRVLRLPNCNICNYIGE